MKIVNLIGQQFGRLVVIKQTGASRGGSKLWECVCECGNTTHVSTRHLNRKNDNVRSCGCLTKERVGENHSDWNGVGQLSGGFWQKHIVKSAKGNGKGRGGVLLTITKEYVWELFQKQKGKCALSGLDITFPIKFDDKSWTASLDRIDSGKGYEPENVQWVHKHINIMKNIYSQEHFIKMCILVADNNLK